MKLRDRQLLMPVIHGIASVPIMAIASLLCGTLMGLVSAENLFWNSAYDGALYGLSRFLFAYAAPILIATTIYGWWFYHRQNNRISS